MNEGTHLVTDLALILISAGVITVIFKLLKQPLVLGYIVAGFIVGPHFALFPTVIDEGSIKEWSELGIIFLMFALGLEFSFKKLFKVGGSAFISAFSGIIAMGGIGFISGYLLGWTTMESVFLGGMLAMSSTTIIIKAFDDLGLKRQKFAELTMAILIIQDLVAIVMMVMLSTAAVSQQFAGKEMALLIVKLVFFLVLWFVVGISVIPTFFRKAKKYINDETLLLISIGLCFGMVALANYVGFSSALGAFVMGSILSETLEGEHISVLIKGIKDLFGAIFFVSVGMMVEPNILAEHWSTILIITLITLFIKAFVSAFGVLISGQTLKTSIKTGFSLAQIGEFAFIIASLGVSLKVMNPTIYPIIVAVSVITTFTTPYCIRLANPCYAWINKKLPTKIQEQLDNYCIVRGGEKGVSRWKTIIRISLSRTIVFSVITFAITVVAFRYFFPFMVSKLGASFPLWLINTMNALIVIIVISPFLYGLMTNKHSTQELYSQLWRESKISRTGIMAWSLFRIFIAVFFVITVLSRCFKFKPVLIFVIALAVVLFVLLSRFSLKRYTKIEDNFMSNLNAKSETETSESEEKNSDT